MRRPPYKYETQSARGARVEGCRHFESVHLVEGTGCEEANREFGRDSLVVVRRGGSRCYGCGSRSGGCDFAHKQHSMGRQGAAGVVVINDEEELFEMEGVRDGEPLMVLMGRTPGQR